jgi:hypothetical protein
LRLGVVHLPPAAHHHRAGGRFQRTDRAALRAGLGGPEPLRLLPQQRLRGAGLQRLGDLGRQVFHRGEGHVGLRARLPEGAAGNDFAPVLGQLEEGLLVGGGKGWGAHRSSALAVGGRDQEQFSSVVLRSPAPSCKPGLAPSRRHTPLLTCACGVKKWYERRLVCSGPESGPGPSSNGETVILPPPPDRGPARSRSRVARSFGRSRRR